MNEIDNKLIELEKSGKPIKVAIIGAGQMGTEIITQIGEMKGMEVAVVVDLNRESAEKGYSWSRKEVKIHYTDDPIEAEEKIKAGYNIASTDYKTATTLPSIDAVVDATGSTEMGAIVALSCIDHKKHIVMMNVECDITIGPILRKMASNAGIVYSLAAGDEPAAIIELYRFAKAIGFDIIAAGKGKNNPLNIYSTPETEQKKADARNMSSRMLCEFVDGSKTAIEMAAVSNATGLVPDIRGMHCAKATVPELNKVFIPKTEGGILEKTGIVDFAIGVHPGVFLVVHTENKRIQEGLAQRDMGNGPYYTLYRPYHLCSIEVPLTIAQCVLYNESHGHPLEKLTSECIAISKKELKKDEILDGIGEYSYRVSIDLAKESQKNNYLPAGLAKGCRLKQDVPLDTILTYDMVQIEKESVLLELRKLQDKLYN
jgi:predicted homoserine dehydrogenase-like protein